MKKQILFFILITSLLLFVINDIAIRFNLYFTTPWIDSVSHTLGGVVVSALLFYKFVVPGMNAHQKSFFIFSFVFLVGIMWEIFELKTGMTNFHDKGYVLDTLGDLFFDMFGGYIGFHFLASQKTNG